MTYKKLHRQFTMVILFFVSAQSYGQNTELNCNVYSGLFSFRGEGAASTSWIAANAPRIPSDYTINPYGKKSGFSYSFEIQGQRITRGGNIYGLGVGFERLESKVSIDTVDEGDFDIFRVPASGKTNLINTFIPVNPFFGRRYLYGKTSFDILAGFDAAFCLKSKEVGEATTNDHDHFTVENDKPRPSIDFRPRIQLKTQMERIGFLAGYSFGLTNYQRRSSPKAYSSFLRVGLSYRLR